MLSTVPGSWYLINTCTVRSSKHWEHTESGVLLHYFLPTQMLIWKYQGSVFGHRLCREQAWTTRFLPAGPYTSLWNRLGPEDKALGPKEKRCREVREVKGKSTGWGVQKPRGQYRISHQEPGDHGSHGTESWDRDLSPIQSSTSEGRRNPETWWGPPRPTSRWQPQDWEPSPPNPPVQCSFLDNESLKSEPQFFRL